MRDIIKVVDTDIMKSYKKSDNIISDMQKIIDNSQQKVFQVVNYALVQRNWLTGHRIVKEEVNGEERAKYGLNIIKQMSKDLTDIYGKSFAKPVYTAFIPFRNYFQIFSTH